MNILGIGLISSRGLGMSAWEEALRCGWQAPEAVADPNGRGEQGLAYRVDLDAVPDRTLLKKLRRADKLSKMSVLAAADALADSGIECLGTKRVGIILATALGAHVTTFEFLDGILDYGDGNVSPTTFSNSVHNAAASYVSSALNIQGPTLTVTQFRFSFPAALQLARTWLDQGRCDYLLVGAADQYGDVLGYVAGQKLTLARDGRITPFRFDHPCHVPGEGAVFFLLGRERTPHAYCMVSAVSTSEDPGAESPVDMTVIEADGMLPDETLYLEELTPDALVAAYSPLVGSMMTGGAFNLATAALMVQQQVCYAAPVQDNPHRLRLVNETRSCSIESIRGLGINCFGEKVVTYLSRVA